MVDGRGKTRASELFCALLVLLLFLVHHVLCFCFFFGDADVDTNQTNTGEVWCGASGREREVGNRTRGPLIHSFTRSVLSPSSHAVDYHNGETASSVGSS